MNHRITDLVAAATAAAEAGAAVSINAWRRRPELTVATKADADDLVSEADLVTQEAIFDALRDLRPGDHLRGEELEDPAPAEAEIEWWVDPIDGTTSFLYGRADWSVSVAAVDARDGRVLAAAVAEPVLNALTSAGLGAGTWCGGHPGAVTAPELARALVDINLGRPEQRRLAGEMVGALTPNVRDLRRGGSAAAALAQLATGRTDAAWLPGLQIWDAAAGLLLAHESGATVGDLGGTTGATWPVSGNILAGAEPLWHQLRDLLVPVYEPRTQLGQ